MRYYSDIVKKFYDTQKECSIAEKKALVEKEEAEKKAIELKETRKNRAKEVEDALEAVYAAENKYKELLGAFLEDYGSFHYSKHLGDEDLDFSSIFSLFEPFTKFFK